MTASETGFSPSRDIGTRRRCPPHSRWRPKRHDHARLAHRSAVFRVVAGHHPSTRTYVSHQRTTLKPSALDESGWASCVVRASQIRMNPLGRLWEGEFAILVPATGSSATGSGGRWGHARPACAPR